MSGCDDYDVAAMAADLVSNEAAVEAVAAEVSLIADAVDQLTAQVDAIANVLPVSGQGRGPRRVVCPACAAAAYYAADADRFVHADGSANRGCWQAITGGEVR